METMLMCKVNGQTIFFSQVQSNTVFSESDNPTVFIVNPQSVSISNNSDSVSTYQPFPSVGDTYYFVAMPNPTEITIQKAVVTQETLNNLNGGKGNIFKDEKDAKQFAKKLMNLFEE